MFDLPRADAPIGRPMSICWQAVGDVGMLIILALGAVAAGLCSSSLLADAQAFWRASLFRAGQPHLALCLRCPSG